MRDLDQHYRKVFRAVLRESPGIHLGFYTDGLMYRNDKTALPADNGGSRHDERFDRFTPL